MNEMNSKNTKLDYIGRSLVLNCVAIVLNLLAVFLIVKGFHESTDPDTGFKLIISGFIILGVTLFSLVLLKGMFLFSYVTRALVGGLFIVSGLVKANDAWGFAFKLEEYFEPSGLSFDYPFFEFFGDYTLELSILISVAEIVIGVAVILGGKIKIASWALVIMMLFFSWLTWYTYSCNINQMLALQAGEDFGRQCVTDCGCFGDALRGSVGRSLTPIESFWKDMILFYLSIIIFVNQWKIKLNTVKENWIMVPASFLVIIFFSWVFGWWFPIIFSLIAILGAFVAGSLNIGKIGKAWKMAIYVAIVSFVFTLYTSSYLPFKDYRPYAVGNNIKEQMNNGIDEIADYVMIYKNLETGEDERVPMNAWTDAYSDTTKYEYVDNDKDVKVHGKDASIVDFGARIYFDDLKEEEKSIPVIDSLINIDYNSYYENKLILQSIYGMDTIPTETYDTLYYPDSVYTKKGNFVGLIDRDMQMSLDLTEYLISADYMFLMTIRDLESIHKNSIEDFKLIMQGAKENNIPFFVLSPAIGDQIEEFKKEYDFDPTFLGFDGVEVKIIVRSNPGLILLKKGTVLDKWPSRGVESFEDIYSNYINVNKN